MMKETSKGDTTSARAQLMKPDGKSFFWGCELTKAKPSVTWTFEEEDDDTDFLQHTLFLKLATLGQNVKPGERQLVQIETTDFTGHNVVQPLFCLKAGTTDMCELNIDFGHEIPVTFTLIEGSGPLYLSAQHVVEFPDEVDGDLTATDTELETDHEIETKATKKRKPNVVTNGKQRKKGKYENASNSDEESEGEQSKEENGTEESDEESVEETKTKRKPKGRNVKMEEQEEEEDSMEASDDDDDDDYVEEVKKPVVKATKKAKNPPKRKRVSK